MGLLGLNGMMGLADDTLIRLCFLQINNIKRTTQVIIYRTYSSNSVIPPIPIHPTIQKQLQFPASCVVG